MKPIVSILGQLLQQLAYYLSKQLQPNAAEEESYD